MVANEMLFKNDPYLNFSGINGLVNSGPSRGSSHQNSLTMARVYLAN